MINAEVLTFREFVMKEKLPLAEIHGAVLEFISGRQDIVLMGAHAVNAYVSEPRMSQDIDLLCLSPEKVSEELCNFLRSRFRIAVRTRKIAKGKGYRVYQVRKAGNRHLADLRESAGIPGWREVEGVHVLAPDELIASKVVSYFQRRGAPKSGTDWRDIAMLLLAFPELKQEAGAVQEHLQEHVAQGVRPEVLAVWKEIVAKPIVSPEDTDDV